MKKIFLTIMVAMSSCMATFSDSLSDGFYRVNNVGSTHYIFVRDCTGGGTSTDDQDVDAIEAWAANDNMYSDPGSIIYLEQVPGSDPWKGDVISQNTGITKILGNYISLYSFDAGWQLYYGGAYLYDAGCNIQSYGTDYSGDRTYIRGLTSKTMKGLENYRLWTITPVSSSTSNYFGFKPSVTANGKKYAPFFADFAYTPVNSSVKTWYVSKVDKTNAVAIISEITGTVAKQQPVFIECAGANASDNKADLTDAEGTAASGNLLSGAYFCNGERTNKDHTGKDPAVVPFNSETMRVLGTDGEGNLAFVSSSANLVETTYYKTFIDSQTTTGLCIPHNTCYLTVDTDCPATLVVMTKEEYDKKFNPTEIIESVHLDPDTAEGIHTISGVKVDEMQQNQLYIVGGKKIISK